MIDLIKQFNEEEQPLTNNFQLITGGKGGPGHNWLIELPVGTIFLCRNSVSDPNSTHPFLQEFEVVGKVGNAVKILNDLNDDVISWVDSLIFCKTISLYNILYKPDIEG